MDIQKMNSTELKARAFELQQLIFNAQNEFKRVIELLNKKVLEEEKQSQEKLVDKTGEGQ